MTRQIIITCEELGFVARDIETNVASQGPTMESARANLKEALELYFEGAPESAGKAGPYYITTLEVNA